MEGSSTISLKVFNDLFYYNSQRTHYEVVQMANFCPVWSHWTLDVSLARPLIRRSKTVSRLKNGKNPSAGSEYFSLTSIKRHACPNQLCETIVSQCLRKHKPVSIFLKRERDRRKSDGDIQQEIERDRQREKEMGKDRKR